MVQRRRGIHKSVNCRGGDRWELSWMLATTGSQHPGRKEEPGKFSEAEAQIQFYYCLQFLLDAGLVRENFLFYSEYSAIKWKLYCRSYRASLVLLRGGNDWLVGASSSWVSTEAASW